MNRQLTLQEKRTVRVAAVCVLIYLALFYGPAAQSYLTARRAAYDKLVQQAVDLRNEIQPYQDKIGTATNLMDRFHMDPVKLKRASVVAEASAAIQQAATSGGVGVGPVREMPGRPSAREAATIKFDGTGPAPAVLALLHNLERIGFPVIIDNIQFSSDPRMPNAVKVSLTIAVLDFDAWKPKEETSHV